MNGLLVIIENWRSWKMRLFWVGNFDFDFLFFFASSQWKQAARSYEVSFIFLHYGWFLQNLGNYLIWTNLHTTVTSSNRGRSYNLEIEPAYCPWELSSAGIVASKCRKSFARSSYYQQVFLYSLCFAIYFALIINICICIYWIFVKF